MSIVSTFRKIGNSLGFRLNSSKTVRYMFPAFLGTLAAASLFAMSASSGDSYVSLSTETQAVKTGVIYPVQVDVSAAVPINAIELTVSFPEDKVEVFGVDRGQSVITIWTEDPKIDSSTVELRGGTFKRGFLGEHQIATINFRALETGQYDIQIDDVRFIAGDGEGTEVVATEAGGTLTMFNFDENTSADEIQVAVQSSTPTDINEDGEITLTDISAFMGAWSNKSRTFDFNGDGKMSFRDFSIILADFFLQ